MHRVLYLSLTIFLIFLIIVQSPLRFGDYPPVPGFGKNETVIKNFNGTIIKTLRLLPGIYCVEKGEPRYLLVMRINYTLINASKKCFEIWLPGTYTIITEGAFSSDELMLVRKPHPILYPLMLACLIAFIGISIFNILRKVMAKFKK